MQKGQVRRRCAGGGGDKCRKVKCTGGGGDKCKKVKCAGSAREVRRKCVGTGAERSGVQEVVGISAERSSAREVQWGGGGDKCKKVKCMGRCAGGACGRLKFEPYFEVHIRHKRLIVLELWKCVTFCPWLPLVAPSNH